MGGRCGEFPSSGWVEYLYVYSSIAQWQSIRLLTEGLLVRAQLGELKKTRSFRYVFFVLLSLFICINMLTLL